MNGRVVTDQEMQQVEEVADLPHNPNYCPECRLRAEDFDQNSGESGEK